MENNDSYTPEEIARMLSAHNSIFVELGNLEIKMTETKNQLYRTRNKNEVDRLFGLVIKSRYHGARQAYKKCYDEAIPENVRNAFEKQGFGIDFGRIE
jgi:hypothetical protein